MEYLLKDRNKLIDRHYRKNYHDLVRYAQRAVGTLPNAEDVVQDAYVNALKYWKEDIEDFDDWFFILLSNCIRKFKRDDKMRGMVDEVPEVAAMSSALPGDIIRRMDEVLNTAYQKETADVLRRYFFDQYKSSEIAEATGMSHANVRVAIHRFRRDFKKLFGDHAEEALSL